MLRRIFNNMAIRTAAAGFAFGLLFPLVAFVVSAHHDHVSVLQMILTHSDPVLYIIDAAPLVLASIGYFAGRRFAVMQSVLDDEAAKRLEDAELVGEYGSWIQNMRTGTVTWSRGFFRVLDLPYDEARVSAAYFHSLLDEDSARRGAELGEKIAKGEVTSFETELRLQLESGRVKWVLSKGAILPPTEVGADATMIGTTRDITAIVEARESAKAAQASLSRVEGIHATIVTYRHEINTPLTVAMHAVDELGEQSVDNPYVKRAQKALSQISILLKTLDRISHQEKIELTSYGRTKESRLLVSESQTSPPPDEDV